jgi:hypothetical protein
MWKNKVPYIGMALAVSGACTKQEAKNEKMILANTIHLESMAIKEKLDSGLAERKLDASARRDSSGKRASWKYPGLNMRIIMKRKHTMNIKQRPR